MRGQIAVALAVALMGTSGRAAGEGRGASSAPTAFVSTRPGEIVVPVTIGSRGPYPFLLDTGSTHTAVTAALADALEAVPVARTTMRATAGLLDCVVVELPPVAIAGVVAAGLTATVLPPGARAALGPAVAGILGQDFLSRFSFTIDYRRSRILWHDRTYAPAGTRLALVPSGDRWVVEIQQPGAAPTYRFVPDSGADTLVIYGEALANRVVTEWLVDPVALASLTGTRTLRTGLVEGLRVGAVTLARQLAVVLPVAAAGEPDGLLPLYGFDSVFFSARDRCLVIQPR
jgi:hypothetical protein